ncbi:MAG TPA: alpha-amylase family glycosyl hydrolase [Candidatus Hydrogenedentes bacterium]|nr:alpha-amylase family glycosyl hydrolase [Candidatus Hydrogenedentota bacterium]
MGTPSLQQISQVNFAEFKGVQMHPSPVHWADQVMYFLLLDRFSDGNEQGYGENNGAPKTSLFDPAKDNANAVQTPPMAAAWRAAGGSWIGGSLKGLESKMGYLARLGITCLWISPVFRQVHGSDAYHGYAIQDYLDVEPKFGTREDLRRVVQTAHKHDIYVILDIILNHAGDVFEYDADRYSETHPETGASWMDPRWDGNNYRVKGFRDNTGGFLPLAPVDPQAWGNNWAQVAVWPRELQYSDTFTQKGRISNWDYDPELYEGDFCSLKNITLGWGAVNDYVPSPALKTLCEVYQYWLAYADVDGYRLDTVKHMDSGAVRFFVRSIHEFAQTMGKDNFYVIGEIAGGRVHAFKTLEATGLDAALGIDDIPNRLEAMMKGTCNPEEYFALFRNSTLTDKDLHIWSLEKIVTMIDDHDQLINGENKARFCAKDSTPELMLAALALNATTMGIPCFYYGSEQCFDGAGGNDRYIREAMLGGAFGAFRSTDRHFFNEKHPVYRELANVLRIRKEHLPLRRGRQYLREISGNGENFGFPRILSGPMRSLIAWSRVFDREEMILAVNTDTVQTVEAWVTVDSTLNAPGAHFSYLHPENQGLTLPVQAAPNGRMTIHLSLPPAGFAILQQAG